MNKAKLVAFAGIAGLTLAPVGVAMAQNGADDPAGHVRQADRQQNRQEDRQSVFTLSQTVAKDKDSSILEDQNDDNGQANTNQADNDNDQAEDLSEHQNSGPGNAVHPE